MLALVLILMPVSYKAGTATAHPHTVFQAIVDQVHGETHSHGEEPAPASSSIDAAQPAFFLSLNIPLSTFADMETPAAAIELMVRAHHQTHTLGLPIVAFDPDLPQLTSVHGASELATALTLLATIWALLFLQHPIRRIWFSPSILCGIGEAIESPPPRQFAS
jgi:hypothetical protein